VSAPFFFTIHLCPTFLFIEPPVSSGNAIGVNEIIIDVGKIDLKRYTSIRVQVYFYIELYFYKQSINMNIIRLMSVIIVYYNTFGVLDEKLITQ